MYAMVMFVLNVSVMGMMVNCSSRTQYNDNPGRVK